MLMFMMGECCSYIFLRDFQNIMDTLLKQPIITVASTETDMLTKACNALIELTVG
jgi:hypothetical protein